MLVALGLHAGRPVTTPEIIDDLWGESAPASAAHTVETYISRLRKVLNLPGQPIVIARNGSGYVLNLDVSQVDAHWFADLAAKGRTALAEGDTARRGPAFVRARRFGGVRPSPTSETPPSLPRRREGWKMSAWSFSNH